MYQILDKISQPSHIKNLSKEELITLSVEIRDYMLHVVSKNGGHLSSNLGIVELTMALHIAFESPLDQMIFDVSHQSYVHKLLTGRFEAFQTLRQTNGMSGFTKRHESDHDVFEAGHSSTSISAAMGMAKARDIMGLQHEVIAIIGDGAMTGGMAFEALNHIGHERTKVIVVLNDNEMSISENVGGLSRYLSKLRTNPSYFKVKHEIQHVVGKIPHIGKPLAHSMSKVKASLKQLVVPGMLFEELGFTYMGLVDGHNIHELVNMFNHAKKAEGPVLIHVKTTKGKGYRHAEERPSDFHGVGPFDLQTGQVIKSSSGKSFSDVFSDAILQLGQNNPKVCTITAAMPSGTGLSAFQKKYPQRFFDVGIAEQHAVTFAAGLAMNHLKPFFAVYSTFLQRAYDQILHDVCIQDLPVTFCIDRAGLVGNDGETHHGAFDLSYLLAMPNMHVMVPKDGTDLRTMLEVAATYKKPLAIRYPRGSAYSDYPHQETTLEPEVITLGNDYQIVAIGRMHHLAKVAMEQLQAQGYHGKMITPKQIKPLDVATLKTLLSEDKTTFVIEENAVIGGFGAYFTNLMKHDLPNLNCHLLGIPDTFVTHGEVDDLMTLIGLDPQGIAHTIKEVLDEGTH